MTAGNLSWISLTLAAGTACAEPANLLLNPSFRFHARSAAGYPSGRASHNVACWNTDAWGDITVVARDAIDAFTPAAPVVGVARIAPGKRLYQFNTLPELGCAPGDRLSLVVQGFQDGDSRLEARMTLLCLESADGTWCPRDFGCPDDRTFSRQGRGELVPGAQRRSAGSSGEGAVTVGLEALPVDTVFERARDSSVTHINTVALLVEFANLGTAGDVWVYAPVLVKGATAPEAFAPGRAAPETYRQLPRTVGKLLRGDPIHIMALGSSIDTGDANPRLYVYDEDPASPAYKQPLWNGGFDAAAVRRPDLADYIDVPKQYLKYTGRLRLELMRKFQLQVSDIFINAMSCGGSSIGESHSGFAEYSALEQAPGGQNGHPTGKSWAQLYPRLFSAGRKPAPDLVIFGHGHNERIDAPDGIAVYEGALRWFQKRFPEVEFLFCQWHSSYKNGNIPPVPERRKLCEHYGIPFIDIVPLIEALTSTWCNHYALCPDGGHPQAGAHTIWFRQLERMFELADPLATLVPQTRLPPRYNPYSYGWEGRIVTYTAPHPRIRGSRMVIDDTAFNLWCSDGGKERMTLVLDGEESKGGSAGNGRQMTRRDPRNSSFVHGRLSLGDRHLLEVLGTGPVTVAALDCKVCDKRRFLPVDDPAWRLPADAAAVEPFASEWGAPYGERLLRLAAGQTLRLRVSATDLSVAYVDRPDAGELQVSVDGRQRLTQACNLPFVDTDGTAHFMANRRGILDLGFAQHTVELRAATGPVSVLGLYTYDTRP